MIRLQNILPALFLLISSIAAFSQTAGKKSDGTQPGSNDVIYFSFRITDRSELTFLTKIVSIDNVKDQEVYAYATKEQFQRFKELGYRFTILPDPVSQVDESGLNMGGGMKDPVSPVTWNFYPTYNQYVTYMTGFAAAHPTICRLDTIGASNQGRLILAVKISDSVNVRRGKPEFLYTSSIHGDELIGYVCMMHLIDSLLTGYGTVPRITDIVNNHQIYINPLANPDGTYHGGNNTVGGAWRYNSNYVDLNRNFPDPKGGPHPDNNMWQTETQSHMHYDSTHHFVMSANFHGGAEVVNYPWDTWYPYIKLHPDNTWFHYISREYADTVHEYSPAGYMNDLENGVTNGAAWYSIEGGRQDYTTYFHYGREVTIEIGPKLPDASLLMNYWNYNRRSFLNYIEQSGYGINGQVTDTVTGKPLKARIFITGHDADNSFQYSDDSTGWYFRPIAEGIWDLTFSCTGYLTQTVHGIQAVNRQTTRLNVRMVPVNYGVPFPKTGTLPLVYPNPTRGNLTVALPEAGGGECIYSVFDGTGKEVRSGVINSTVDPSLVRIDLTPLPQGIYLLMLKTAHGSYQVKILIHDN